tara:strand:+ start:182 stop:2317 length:2136 start_codon:yes stop_codon:yes gene_type:complete
MTKDTMKNKSQLAKLLATENIEVQENAVQTASFDVVNRILTIPVFKEEQKCKHVYDMLVGHEVSHALYTPSDSWKEMAKRSKEFKSFVNVIEDARIDKLIQKKYPGLKDDYLKGFDKMLKDNFFGTKDKDMMSYALIDKINLYYKSSKRLDFKFTNKEKILVDAVDKCKNFDDVLKLAEDILGYCKKELEKKPELQKVYKPDPLGDKKSDSDTDSNDSEKSTDEKLDEWLDKKSESDDADEKAKKKETNQTGGNGAGSPDNTPTELRALTADNYENSVKGITDESAHSRCYAELPKVDLKKLIIPYNKFIRDITLYDKQHHNTEYDKQQINKAKVRTQKFIKESSNVVNFLVKEFEMKKNAKLYARASQDKTGIIDPLKLHSYKFAEDIFKKITTVPNQKNHGMILLLDWSGSMQKHILATVEQLINLTMFVKKINIPFSVYAFMNNHREEKDNYSQSGFNITPKSIRPDASTKLVQLFSHKQSKVDFTRTAQILHRAALYFGDYYSWRTRHLEDESVPSISGDYYLSSTPLNESLVAMDHVIKKFKTDYKTDKVALVTLTDGASNSMHHPKSGELHLKLNGRYVPAHSYWRDKRDFTSVMLRYLKKKYDLQLIGFYLVSKYRELQYMLNVPYGKELLARKMFNKDKFIADYDTAYDVYFYVNSGTRVRNNTFENDKDTTNKRTLKKMFMSGMKNRINSRVLLQNFIKRIA